jgi:hypothetical protein
VLPNLICGSSLCGEALFGVAIVWWAWKCVQHNLMCQLSIVSLALVVSSAECAVWIANVCWALVAITAVSYEWFVVVCRVLVRSRADLLCGSSFCSERW